MLSAPVQLAVAAVVRARLGRPVLLRQPRLGEGGRPFVILKFRTMKPDRRVAASVVPVAQERRSGHPSYDDPRHTRIGTILRRWSLDELPQLVERRARRHEPRRTPARHGERRRPLRALAARAPHGETGAHGVWQVEQRHERGELREFAAVDIVYARAVSFRLDFRVLVRTPIALVRRPAPLPAERGARERTTGLSPLAPIPRDPDPLDR